MLANDISCGKTKILLARVSGNPTFKNTVKRQTGGSCIRRALNLKHTWGSRNKQQYNPPPLLISRVSYYFVRDIVLTCVIMFCFTAFWILSWHLVYFNFQTVLLWGPGGQKKKVSLEAQITFLWWGLGGPNYLSVWWGPKSSSARVRGQSCSWEGGAGRGAWYYFGRTK